MSKDQHENRSKKKAEVTIYTDGACPGQKGPGGWGAVLFFGDQQKEYFRRRKGNDK